MIRKTLFALLLVISHSAFANYWTQKANVPTGPRVDAIGFALNGYGYFGTGVYQSFSYNDFWMYNPQSNTWTAKANIGWYWKQDCVGFSVAGKGYVSTGYNMSNNIPLVETWEYSDVSNTWTQKADYPGQSRYKCFSMVIGNKAFVGGGTDGINLHDEMYEYDPSTNMWTQKANFPGMARNYITTFTIGNFGYAGNGSELSATAYPYYYKYDPSVNTWFPVANYPYSRVTGAGFSLNGKGYVGMGGFFNQKDFFSYNPTSNTWTQEAYFGGYGGEHAVSFVLNNKGYVADLNGSATTTELWEYTPSTVSVEELTNSKPLVVYPTITSEYITVRHPVPNTSIEYILCDASGKEVKTFKSDAGEYRINLENFPAGIYYVTAHLSSSRYSAKIIRK